MGIILLQGTQVLQNLWLWETGHYLQVMQRGLHVIQCKRMIHLG